MGEHRLLYVPGIFSDVQAGATRKMQGIHDFAEHVELKLPVCRVANAYRP